MKKALSVVLVATALLVAFGGVGVAFAQEPGTATCPMYGGGRGAGGLGGGLLHEEMEAAVAARLNLSVEEFEARRDAGETVWSIARAQGLSDDEIVTLMQDARAEALAAAVENGDLTQEQADWMAQRMGGRGQNGTGARGMGRNGGGMGMGLRGGWAR